jgi:hypothetical protein
LRNPIINTDGCRMRRERLPRRATEQRNELAPI